MEIKNILRGTTSRLDEAEDQISKLEHKAERNTRVDQLHQKRLNKHKDSLKELQDNMKHNNIQTIGIPKRKKRNKG